MAVRVLQKNMQLMQSSPLEGVKKCEFHNGTDLHLWDLSLIGPSDSIYNGLEFNATLTFPKNFPMDPPVLRITSPFWHPNVYPDGKVCMTILHRPEGNMEDQLRWSPVLGVDKIVLSFLSLLDDPDPSEAGAPANVEALHQWRHNRPEYLKRLVALGARIPGMESSQQGSSGGRPAVPSHPYGEQVRLLQEMGVSVPEAQMVAVLTEVNGDVERAANMLFDQ
eukprot:PhM_4_TR13519/c0_g1_i1/m.56052/K10575/UBE2G1, UBC7; ubiquitin-conjugating enzyme E2 G1